MGEGWLASLLRGIAVGVCAVPLAGCTTCHQAPVSSVAPTESLSARYPAVVAALWAQADLRDGPHDVPRATCRKVCGEEVVSCTFYVTMEQQPPGKLDCVFGSEEECHFQSFAILNGNACVYGCGRLPDGVVARLGETIADPIARHFSEIALLEALSVRAFAELESDLRAHGVAGELLGRVRRARQDERRHARQARAVVARLGAMPPDRHSEPIARSRSLEAIARSNAVDGCVRETFGALLGCIQARRAEDPDLRAFFVAIERDELAHAALAWDLHRALCRRLSPAARARVARAQRVALEELAVTGPVPRALVRRAGAPSAVERAGLARTFAATLPFEGAA